MEYLAKTFLDKEVKIYPSDTYSMYGIVRDMSEHGVVFEITKSQDLEYKIGSLWFQAWHKLSFKLADLS